MTVAVTADSREPPMAARTELRKVVQKVPLWAVMKADRKADALAGLTASTMVAQLAESTVGKKVGRKVVYWVVWKAARTVLRKAA